MTKRPCGMVLRFTKAEMDALNKKAKKANKSREGFCRAILNGAEVKEAPPVDWSAAAWELRRLGNNINQLLVKANTLGFIDVPMLRKALEETHELEDKFFDLFTMTEE